jgi:hypothetical protein
MAKKAKEADRAKKTSLWPHAVSPGGSGRKPRVNTSGAFSYTRCNMLSSDQIVVRVPCCA